MEQSRISTKDAFCDYTSINGIRFLHSRHPLWFRYLSAFVLILAVALFIIHIRIFIEKLLSNRESVTFSSNYDDGIYLPRISFTRPTNVLSCTSFNGKDCMNGIVNEESITLIADYETILESIFGEDL